ncbi:MAG: hypothetical protein V4692_00535 [Bdellovibrionota bacterium]
MKTLNMLLAGLLIAPVLSPLEVKADDEVKVTCEIVRTKKEALNCIKKLAQALPSYEEPNESMIAKRADSFSTLLSTLDNTYGQNEYAKVSGKDHFVGAILQHMDEHHLYYVVVPKGTNVSPVEVTSINEADVGYQELTDAQMAALTPRMYLLGNNPDSFDIGASLEEGIQEMKDEAKERAERAKRDAEEAALEEAAMAAGDTRIEK